MPVLKPKLLTTLQGYTREQFVSDAVAGLIVGIVALPLAIAFAIASGVSPERGLFTAIVAGFLISALGGSRVQIGGPTGAFVVIVYGIVQQFGLDGLRVATLIAGVMLVAMGLAKFGSLVKFMAYPVIVGFTTGIAVIIFSSQMKDFFGLQMGVVPAEFLGKWEAYFHHSHTINPTALALGIACLGMIIGWKRVSPRIPGSLVALIVSTVVVQLFHLPVETIGSRFGSIPSTLPAPSLPPISLDMIRQVFPAAITIALLAGIESLLSATVSDGMIGGRHRSNMELIAQGVANIASPIFGGIPATGAIARTATNVKNGGRTPVAGIIHALVLLLIMLCLGKWAVLIPMACLAAILVVVAYNMSEWHSFQLVLRCPRSDVLVLLTTFALTVLVDLTAAIQVGMVLSVFLFIRRVSAVTNINVLTGELGKVDEEGDGRGDTLDAPKRKDLPKGVEVYEINGLFFFGAAYKFREAMRVVNKAPKVRILQMRHVLAMDATGIIVLKDGLKEAKSHKIGFILIGLQPQPLAALKRVGLYDEIGAANFVKTMDEALMRARNYLAKI